jgi:hypothetical protein
MGKSPWKMSGLLSSVQGYFVAMGNPFYSSYQVELAFAVRIYRRIFGSYEFPHSIHKKADV